VPEMKLLKNEDIPVDLWNDFLEKNPHSTPFQSPGFYRFLNKVDNITAEALAVSDDGILKALAVIAVQAENGRAAHFSKRGIIFGGPLAEGECPEALDMLLKKIDEYTASQVIYLETRNLSDYNSYKEVFISNGYKYISYLNFRVDTRDIDSLRRRVSSSRLRQIRKAQQKSVTCREAGNKDEVVQFYNMLKSLYKRKLHKPVPEEDFFLKFYEAGIGKYFLVWHDEKIIGGIMCPILSGKAIYEFYVCGLDDEYNELHPSVMATWSAIEFACINAIPLFDFMGAGKPSEQYGVRNFKARFGGEPVEYGRFLKVRRPLLFQIGKAGLKIMKHIG